MLQRRILSLSPLLIVVAALAVRIALMLATGSYDHPNEEEPGIIAHNILDGKGFSIAILAEERPTAGYAPLGPYFYAAVHALLGYTTLSCLVVVLIRSLLSVATAYVVYRIALLAFDHWIAKLALLATAFHPASLYYSSVITHLARPPFSMFFLSLVVLSLIRFSKKPDTRTAVGVGLLSGVAVLYQSEILIVLVLALPWMGWSLWRDRGGTLHWKDAHLLLYAPVLCLLLVSPWTLRNYLVMTEFVLVRSTLGTLFWIGNNPIATGDFSQAVDSAGRVSFDIEAAKTLDPEVLAAVESASEVQRDKILAREALEFVKANPGAFLKLTIRRFGHFWFGPPKFYQATMKKKIAIMAFSLYSLVVLCGIVAGTLSTWTPAAVLFLIPITTYTAIHSLTHAGFHYYRMPIEPYGILLTIVGAARLYERFRWRQLRAS